MEDSKLVEAIVKDIGELSLGLFMLFPPLVLMAPFCLLFWFCDMLVRRTPVVSLTLCECANKEELPLLLELLARRNNRPYAFDLWRLKNKLRTLAEEKDNNEACTKIQQHQTH